VGHASRFSALLHVEVSLARVFRSGLKTGRGTTAGGTRDTIAEVASEASRRQTDQCDVLRRTLLPYLCCFYCIRR
jgi:hypothetical protein